jgi:hypothetical protein
MTGKMSDDTPGSYSDDEVAEMQAMAREPGRQPVCPDCREHLNIGPPFWWGGRAIRELRCPRCNRCAMIDDAPGAF